MKYVLIALAIGGTWFAARRFRRFADPDPSVYGQPRPRAGRSG